MKIVNCDACRNGQVKASATEYHMEPVLDSAGKPTGRQRYVTDTQGSGCIKCGGTMRIPECKLLENLSKRD